MSKPLPCRTVFAKLILGAMACSLVLPSWADKPVYPGYGLSAQFQSCTTRASKAVSWADWVQCMDQEAERLEKRMDKAYERNLRASNDPQQQEHMRASQRLWTQYMHEECSALRNKDEGNPSDLISECAMLKTARRVQELTEGTR